jgi:hypothetical protein
MEEPMRRLLIPLVALALFFGLFAQTGRAQRRREPKWDRYDTKHYKILHSCSKIEASYLGDWMEFVHKAYSVIIKVKSDTKHVIKLFRDRREWNECGQPPGAGAYYTLHTKQLVGYYDRRAVFPYFAHEGTHQFIHIAVPDMPRLIPTWFNEGLADCMGSSKVINKKFRWCLFNALIAKGRSYTIKKALREGTARKLTDLFALTHRQFMGDAKLHYAQSWSMVHFLFCYPHVELPKKWIPNGKYKKAIVVYFDLLRKGTPHAEAWNEALGTIGKTHEEIEKEWKEYVLNTLPDTGPSDDDAYMGVRTQESKRGGMEVVSVVPGGPAEQAGFQVGDRIVYFEKKKIRNYDIFIAELKKRKPGDEIKVTVVRGRKTERLKLVLGRRGDYDKKEEEKKKKKG